MADNLPVSPGTGATIAADDVGGVLHQRVKVVIGADGASDGDISSVNPMPVTGSVTTGGLTDTQLRATAVPVSGTVTANTGLSQPLTDTQLRATAVPVSVSGVATAANQSTEITALGTINTTLGSPMQSSGGSVTANAGTNLNTSALALESGGHLNSIDTKTPALGQALAAASVPVVLTAAQITTLTPPSSVSVSNFPATQPVSGTVAVSSLPAIPTGSNAIGSITNTSFAATQATAANLNATVVGTGTFATQVTSLPALATGSNTIGAISNTSFIATQATGTNLHTVVDSLPAIPAGTNVIGHVIVDSAPTTAVTGTFYQATQPVSIASSVAVTGPLTDTQLRATAVPVSYGLGSFDIFGSLVVGSRNNQIEEDFSTFGVSTLNLVTSGGGTTTNGLGYGIFSSGTAVTAQSSGSTYPKIQYDPGHEVYAEFTTNFTTPTSVNSYQRIGLYDANNGFFFGYNGTTFGVTLRSGAVDTFIAQSSWNKDVLNGSVGSKFTNNGSPVAADWTKINFFRIRFGWLGIAPVTFEVLGPDGTFLQVHQINFANLVSTPSIQSPNLPITIDVSKSSADATDLIMNTICWGAGTTAPPTQKKLGVGTSSLDSAQVVYSIPSDGAKATYSSTKIGLVAAATPTDIFTITGSATKVIRIIKVTIDGTQTTAAKRDIVLLKRSTANTAGTSTGQTEVPHDSTSAAATATVLAYTANPTLGTLIGNIVTRKVFIGTTTTTTNDSWSVDFGNRPSQAVVLRGINEVFAINLNSITSTGNLFDITIEWTEEDYIR